MIDQPKRLKRAVQRTTKGGARIVSITPITPGQRSRVLPDAEVASALRRDPLAEQLAAAVFGVKKSVPQNVTIFERASVPLNPLGLRSKAPSITIAYVRHDAPQEAAFMQRFATAGAHELRREGRQGRNVLRGVLNQLQRGDVLLLEKLADLCIPADLPRLAKEIEAKGVAIATLDGCDTRTPDGRGKLALSVLAAKQLFPALRL